MTEPLKIIDADTLLSSPMRKPRFIVDGFLPEGISLFCGASKVGKSWLMLWLSLQVAQGNPVWNMETHKCDVLYLCLEDTFHRIQNRLYLITETAPDNLYLAVSSGQINHGLQKQIHAHMQDYPKTKLIVIDTLQKVRNPENGSMMSYTTDYEDVTALKKIADRYGIAIILVHHLRKNPDPNDPFNQIAGTTGLMGAADSSFVISKSSRSDETAMLFATGRDIEYQQLTLRFQERIWHLESHKGQAQLRQEAIPPFLFRVVEFITQRREWKGTASQLLAELGDMETSPTTVTRLLGRFYEEVLKPNNIGYETKRTAKERLILLKARDSNDENDSFLRAG